MGIRFKIDLAELQSKLGEMVDEQKARAENVTPVLEGRAEALRTTIIRDVFGKGQSPFGVPWAPLSPATLARRRGGTATILVDIGTLRDSFSAEAEGQSIFFGIFGPAAVYAPTHQFGRILSGTYKAPRALKSGKGSRSKRAARAGRAWSFEIPARPFLPLNPAGEPSFEAGPARTWKDRLMERVVRYIVKGEL